MELGFCTRKGLLAWFREGWRILPGHEYEPGDWAILLYMPTYPKPVSEELMQEWAKRFQRPAPTPAISNIAAANRCKPRTPKKLNEILVAAIRRRIATGEKHWRVAEQFGIARATVSDIHNGRTWAGIRL